MSYIGAGRPGQGRQIHSVERAQKGGALGMWVDATENAISTVFFPGTQWVPCIDTHSGTTLVWIVESLISRGPTARDTHYLTFNRGS